ncbi:hypothetical protein L3X38_019723 [Prunus dulcis]|uniref:Receptor-like serine/threonine-protein kinase n=1 Tax=Prunus dulcis TaxID=3755 RepID=A0AAD4ZCA7_PRUDU|nr:hypothetical protein L3X38_019723 [Prunus dulcis]
MKVDTTTSRLPGAKHMCLSPCIMFISNLSWFANRMLSSIFSSYALLLLCFSHHLFCSATARDTLTSRDDPIRDDGSDGLVSAGGRFELGFFTPPTEAGRSGNGRYVGIWYHNMSPRTVVWVANREDQPVAVNSTSTGAFAIKDGNLQVLDNTSGKSYWSTGLETSKSLNLMVSLMDSGNLVLLRDGDDDPLAVKNILWQSFQNPTDTFIPGMVMDQSLELTSWRDQDDPGIGNFTFKLDVEGDNQNQYVITKLKSIIYWKSREPAIGTSVISDEMHPAVAYLLSNFSQSYLKKINSSIIFRPTRRNSSHHKEIAILPRTDYNHTRLVIDFKGNIQFLLWNKNKWTTIWSEPKDQCSVFNACGNFGLCNMTSGQSVCKCLPGYKPQSPDKWKSRDFSDGCTRGSLCLKNETFSTLKIMKVGKPEIKIHVSTETECKNSCLNNCQCIAYSYAEAGKTRRRDASTSMCWIWDSQLDSLQEEYADGRNLSVRVFLADSVEEPSKPPLEEPSKPPLEEHSRRQIPLSLIVVAVLVSIIFVACIISIYIWRRKMTSKRDQISRGQFDSERQLKELIETSEFKEEEGIDVPLFDLQSILDATDNFSDANKLGQGGYGPVYKGKLLGGQEIAVKRLSRVSGQGLQEFKNEVVLIAKLQHRNLVRLKGYCMKGEEKILLYEYMPNKSLDSFIFDRTQKMFLNWEMRFNIILGIARGLLYLHQDSRLRIIHRDLKTSNILLDEEMNPKISDFGLARIVGGKETESSTNTVVGTYGYMSPEYALDGTFSVKSDVFSFGVVVLEIISGKKNTGLYQSKETFSLINHAWRLWTENKVLDLMDNNLDESCNKSQFIKCVNVGLLCVQEDPVDRPAMSNVLTMLDSEIAIPPTPKQPPFVMRRGNRSSTASSSTKPETFSEITTTLVEGR